MDWAREPAKESSDRAKHCSKRDVHVNCFDQVSNVLARHGAWGWRLFVFT